LAELGVSEQLLHARMGSRTFLAGTMAPQRNTGRSGGRTDGGLGAGYMARKTI
jgi:hypothetical protein